MNKVILVGNLTNNPEGRATQGGTSVCTFTVAVNRRYTSNGQQQTDFPNCIAFGKTADFVCRYFQKGQSIALCGRLQTRTWDGQDGQRHYVTEVVAEEVNFNGSKTQNSATNTQGYPAYNNGGYATTTRGNERVNNQYNNDDWQEVNADDIQEIFGGDEGDLPF